MSGSLREGTLSFEARATLGDFVGSTTKLSGEMTGAPDDLRGVRGWVEAPANSFGTGNTLRDRDLNKSLESATFPTLRFDLTSVTTGHADAGSTPVTLGGTLTIHGVSRMVHLEATVHPQPAGIRLRSQFPLHLTDYDIGGLSKMFGMFKMHPEIVVNVDVIFNGD